MTLFYTTFTDVYSPRFQTVTLEAINNYEY